MAGELRSDDQMLRGDNINTVGERRTGQIGIQQGDDPTDAGDTEPYSKVFRSIGHQQADYLALTNALLKRPSRVLIDALREFAVGHTLAVREQRWCITQLCGTLLNHRGKNAMAIARNGRSQLQGAQPGLSRRNGVGCARYCFEWAQFVFPASTVITVPVMLFAPSPSRNSTATLRMASDDRTFQANE